MVVDNRSLAMVTGSAHRLGRAFAFKLARMGYAILLHYHESQKNAEVTADEIRTIGAPVSLFRADLTNPAEIQMLFKMVDSLPQKLAVLVNSAAIMQRSDIRDITVDDWDHALNLNLRAPFLLAQKSAERMTGGGVIVNITDVGAYKLWTGYITYTVSKSALDMLTKLLAKIYAPGIRVNAIAPGLVLPSDNVSTNEWEKLVNRLPLKRKTTEDDITSALEYIIRNEAVTGQTIEVDGGYSLL